MDEELNIDNILDANEIDNLFADSENSTEETQENNQETKEQEEKQKEETTEVSVEDLFDEPESVGSGKDDDKKEKEDTVNQGSSSPNFYSSMAKALKEDGIFPDLEDDTVGEVNNPEAFLDLIKKQIQAGLDERQKRIDDALNAGIEPTEVKKYENTLAYLDSINEDSLKDEGEEGEKLRKRLIYQDFINRGYSEERATREVQKSLNSGSDIEDAKEALKSNKEFFKEQYDTVVEEAKKEEEKEKTKLKEQADNLKKSILEDKNLFGEVEVDKPTRQRVFDNISKPVYRDPNTGSYLTALQKYALENRIDFLKNVGLIFTLTDGFKNLNGLVKGKIKKEVNKGLRELEQTINNTSRGSDGNLKFVSGVSEDPESFIGKGWNLDV